MRTRIAVLLAFAIVGNAACSNTPAERSAGGQAIGMANPASVNCTQRGGKLQIVSTPAGQTGICTFPSGKQCEEWALMRGECTPG
ncbi:putative hemolysin [Cupriavidus sp. TMH.W2]|uniref:putative hemolysin n=1 Tax=Cupriavidus sp. TMH.W2 TaxID=3434465 RepID=UPI003D784EAD